MVLWKKGVSGELKSDKMLYPRSVLNLRLYFPSDAPSTATVKACARLAATKKASPVNPTYTRAYLLSAVVALSSMPTAMLAPMMRGWSQGRKTRGTYAGAIRRNAVRRASMRTAVRRRAARTTVPRDGWLARVNAAWIVCVEVGGGGGRSGLQSQSTNFVRKTVINETHLAKYHAPMTPAVVTRNKPLPTPQLQSQTTTVPTIAQLAHPLTCHSHVELVGCEKYPIKRSRKMRVRNGMEATRAVSRMTGDRARRKGLAISSCVVNVKMEDVVWISRGRSNSRRAVSKERTRGIRENRRRLIMYYNVRQSTRW
jgi:hypothetical protein